MDNFRSKLAIHVYTHHNFMLIQLCGRILKVVNKIPNKLCCMHINMIVVDVIVLIAGAVEYVLV